MNQIRLIAYPDGTRARVINISSVASEKMPTNDEVLMMMLDDEIQKLRAELNETKTSCDGWKNSAEKAYKQLMDRSASSAGATADGVEKG